MCDYVCAGVSLVRIEFCQANTHWGGYRVFQKGGLRPATRKAGGGGGGVLSALDPTRKAGEGTVRRFRPDTKSGEGGGAV